MIELAASNASVTRLRRLQRRRDARESDACIVVEGVQGVREALTAHRVQSIFLRADERDSVLASLGAIDPQVPIHVLDRKTFDSVATTVTPQPALAVVGWRPTTIDDVVFDRGPALVLDGVGDPGNVGTIVRVADASGACALFAGPGTADVTASKVVRAAAGSLLRVPVVTQLATHDAIDALRTRSVRCVGASAGGARTHDEFDWSGPVAVVLGSEAHGLDDRVRARLDDEVRIDMAPGAESLNVAVAAAVLAFEIRRQRAKGGRS